MKWANIIKSNLTPAEFKSMGISNLYLAEQVYNVLTWKITKFESISNITDMVAQVDDFSLDAESAKLLKEQKNKSEKQKELENITGLFASWDESFMDMAMDILISLDLFEDIESLYFHLKDYEELKKNGTLKYFTNLKDIHLILPELSDYDDCRLDPDDFCKYMNNKNYKFFFPGLDEMNLSGDQLYCIDKYTEHFVNLRELSLFLDRDFSESSGYVPQKMWLLKWLECLWLSWSNEERIVQILTDIKKHSNINLKQINSESEASDSCFDECVNIVTLNSLDLIEWNITKIPKWIKNLLNLESLNLYMNDIKNLPREELLTMRNLKEINLLANPLEEEEKVRIEEVFKKEMPQCRVYYDK